VSIEINPYLPSLVSEVHLFSSQVQNSRLWIGDRKGFYRDTGSKIFVVY
jgi:hypothetical protein